MGEHEIAKRKMRQLLKDKRNVHILYSYTEISSYLNQVLDFIEEGILAGDFVILIENDRNYPLIYKELCTRFTKGQMKSVHFVNNFNFYMSSGSYDPPAIKEYFFKMIQPHLDNNVSFRTWAHVEWASMKEPWHLIGDVEKLVDQTVNLQSFPLICAYEGKRMPDNLKTILMETHPYVLLDDDFIVSQEYQPSEAKI